MLILVPARGGSKRLPGKNLRTLAGRSLLAHTAEAVAASGLSAPVMLTTDNEEIASEGRRLGWQVPFLRPAELARDDSPTISAVVHALDWWSSAHGVDIEAVMVLQPTSPLRGSACLVSAVAMLETHPEYDSVIAVNNLHLPANRVFLPDDAGGMSPFARNDLRGPVYVPNGALYLTRTQALRRENTLYAGATHPLVLSAPRGLDVDTETDWLIAEALLAAMPEAAGAGS